LDLRGKMSCNQDWFGKKYLRRPSFRLLCYEIENDLLSPADPRSQVAQHLRREPALS
jgi:hypothetical protein